MGCCFGFGVVRQTQFQTGEDLADFGQPLRLCRLTGLQFGLVNVAGDSGSGLQLGLFNGAPKFSGIQIGVLNVIGNAALPVLPVVNGNF